MLANVGIQAAITAARNRLQERTQITVDRVVGELALIAMAAPRELVEHIVSSCRHCHARHCLPPLRKCKSPIRSKTSQASAVVSIFA
ncbi:Terminase small subunit [compost metagenome]